MKNIIRIITASLIISLLTISLIAADRITDSNKVIQEDITIIYSDTTQLTTLQKEQISSYLVTGEQSKQMQAMGLLCTLLGHNMEDTGEGIIKITHRAFATQPRCLKQTYAISSCTRCGELSSKLIGDVVMSCCS